MENVKWNYFQYRKAHGYPVFIRFRQEDLHSKFVHLAHELGFQELTDTESRKIQLQRAYTRVLTIQTASARLEQQINGSDLMEKYGPESLSLQAGMPVYTYRKVGLMVMPYAKVFWDLALNHDISHTEQMVGLRVILVRFLTQALADLGVLSYWGTVKDDNVVVMKQVTSFGEAVFIDVDKKLIFSNGGEVKLGGSLKIIRKDKEFKQGSFMSREELISFLSVSTCLLSFSGVTHGMKRSIYELSLKATGAYGVSENSASL